MERSSATLLLLTYSNALGAVYVHTGTLKVAVVSPRHT
jgi:hypothetical protein